MTCQCCGDEGVECDMLQDEDTLLILVVCKKCIKYSKEKVQNMYDNIYVYGVRI